MADLGTKFCKKAHMMVVGIISTGLQPAYNWDAENLHPTTFAGGDWAFMGLTTML